MKRKGVAIWAALAALGVLAGAEVFARIGLGLGTPPLTVADPDIEYMLQPGQDVRRFGNRILVNAYGMRSQDFPARKPDGEIRIMVIGDSVVNGGNLTDHERLATTILQRELAETLGRRVVVGNISAGSWGPGNWLAYVERYGFFDADLVVVVASSHDASDNPTFEPLHASLDQKTPKSALLEGIERYLIPRYLPGLNASPPKRLEPVNSEATARGLGDLRALFAAARDANSRVVVFQHWTRTELESRVAEPGNAHIQILCTQIGVDAVSLAPAMRRSVEAGTSPYRDYIHLNDEGQRALEQAIGEYAVVKFRQ